ncbi:MAG: hypothetical protein S4CHLAM81_07850 [Chlamydiales bacterium]|nr:hypothetical protein [Chlamydiales bacterium]MCH9635567.1 hypothetical protein [Chlamydiales bacterium]MCH9704074.1 ATP-binding protein [Chlamydiota bacterium]
MHYFHRKIEPQLKKAIAHFPATLITGARQVGKSTLLRKILPNYDYITFDDPILRAAAKEDPALFLSSYSSPLIIDEIQYVPELLPYIKMEIDQKRQKYGRYVLTGSQNFALMENITESLAGRIAILNLYPFSWLELEENDFSDQSLQQHLLRGFYPELYSQRDLDPYMWYASYLATYIERDVRNIKAIVDLQLFQKFVLLLALRAGQLLNLNEIEKECGITHATAKRWLSILESSYIIYLLRPYYRNQGKRLIKSPKIYFYDTGLLCYLQGISDAKQLLAIAKRGHLFENMMVIEAVKQFSFTMSSSQLFFYRTSNQKEVDLLVESAGRLRPFEIKYFKAIKKSMTNSLETFLTDYDLDKGWIVSLYPEDIALSHSVTNIHWSKWLHEL